MIPVTPPASTPARLPDPEVADTARVALAQWLTRCESMHVRAIELGLSRVEQVRERLAIRFDVPVITVAGTNGKGSTCAMLECILGQAGYRTGVYSSPHLVHFEERLRLQGAPVETAALLPHFEAVEVARGEVPLTYFEFTTLVFLRCMSQLPLDAVILEVGLGGRLDAVNVIDADCAILTSIDLDHMDFLGPDREAIGFEKAGILRAGRPAIVSDPMPPASVVAHANAIGADLWLVGRDFAVQGDRQQWGFTGRGRRLNALAYPALRGANQLVNAAGVLAALEALRPRLPVPMQAVRNGLAFVDLPGRFQVVPGQPAVVLDVGHNPHAMATLAHNLDQMGYFPSTRVVFGAMADKDIEAMVKPLLPLVEAWFCCDLDTPRAARATVLEVAVQRAAATHTSIAPMPLTSAWETPRAALLAALAASDPADRIVVFGSFHTVGGVLKDGLPRPALGPQGVR
jgi:dihydrofolate synthase / folylpolyglutamate synthase